ncbi:MAG: TlpA family protein disulfide reductase [Acidobacteriota bacterium]|nr:TlpA family protein disulfide reductase [Acidobacteriota bacterium]
MRRAFVVSLLAVGAFAAQTPRPAPDFAIQVPGGPPQLLSAYKGKTIVLAFMYTTCTHCQKTAGELSEIQKEYAARGVQVLGVTFDLEAAKRVKGFNKVFGVTFPCGYSAEKPVLQFLQQPASEPYFVPILVFIDRNFQIRSQYIGDEKFLGNIPVTVRAELDGLLK